MLAHWLSVLMTYDFEIVHRRGTKHGNADALSNQGAASAVTVQISCQREG